MKKAVLCITLATLLILGVGSSGLAQDALKSAASDIDKGWQNMDIPLLEKTVTTFEELAKKNPKDHLAPFYAARAHFAITDCLDIKSEQEFDTTGESDKHLDASMELLKTSLALKEDSLDTQLLRFHAIRRKMLHVSFPGLMMYISDRTATHTRLKELGPENINVQFIDALQVAEGWPPPPPEKPIAEFEKILKKDPKMADAYYEIGRIWEGAKKTDEAKKNYGKALEINPKHHWAKKKIKGLSST